MAKITSFTIQSITANAGNLSVNVVFNPTNEEYNISMNDDNTLDYVRETIKQEAKRRNKVDDLAITLQQYVGANIVV